MKLGPAGEAYFYEEEDDGSNKTLSLVSSAPDLENAKVVAEQRKAVSQSSDDVPARKSSFMDKLEAAKREDAREVIDQDLQLPMVSEKQCFFVRI